jgi:hypothetical protein
MTQLHAWSALAAAVVFALLAIGAGAASLLGRGFVLLGWLRLATMAVALVAVAIGALLFATGARPDELLHILYGIALIAVLPLAMTFAEEAPVKARAGVVAGAALIGLILTWRLFVTG